MVYRNMNYLLFPWEQDGITLIIVCGLSLKIKDHIASGIDKYLFAVNSRYVHKD